VNRIVKRVAKGVGVLALIALAASTVLLGALWVDHGRSTLLPAPSGSYRVGRATYVWRVETRINPYTPVADTKQDLAVWIWYQPPRRAPRENRNIFLDTGFEPWSALRASSSTNFSAGISRASKGTVGPTPKSPVNRQCIQWSICGLEAEP
jgi:hypothetical protein